MNTYIVEQVINKVHSLDRYLAEKELETWTPEYEDYLLFKKGYSLDQINDRFRRLIRMRNGITTR